MSMTNKDFRARARIGTQLAVAAAAARTALTQPARFRQWMQSKRRLRHAKHRILCRKEG